MASEQSMRKRVVRALRPLDAHAVENICQPGTPDVECIGGWIELKSAGRWPARSATPLRLEHFTPQQRLWLRKRRQKGGRAWLLLRVRQEWLLFDGAVAAVTVGHVCRTALAQKAAIHWKSTPSDAELLHAFLPCATPTASPSPSSSGGSQKDHGA